MKKVLFIVLFIMMNVSIAQNILPDTSKMTNTEKMLWYQNEKKSPARAIFYSWLIPTSGHAYAGDWNRGLKFKAGELAFFLGGILYANSGDGKSSRIGDFRTDELVFSSFLVGSGVVLILEYIDVVKTTKKHNLRLYKDLFGEKSK